MANEHLIETMLEARSFFENGSGGKRVYLDTDILQQLCDLLLKLEKEESDPKTREAIHSIIDQFMRPVMEALDAADTIETDNAGTVDVCGYVTIDRDVRQKIIDAISADAPAAVIKSLPKFAAMLQGPGTNELSRLNSRSAKPTVNSYTGEGQISTDTLTAFIAGYKAKSIEFRPSTWKLLDVCAILLNGRSDYRGNNDDLLPTQVKISLEDYAELCGKPKTKSAIDELRKQVKADLETLFRIEIEWTEKTGRGKKQNYAKMRIISSQGIRNGEIFVGFSPEMKEYLNNAYIMQYPLALLKVDDRNPSTYQIGRKLSLHAGIYNNLRKGTANIISVKALLDACAFTIPSYEEVAAQRGNMSQRIITPFEKALDALATAKIIKWEYSNSKGEPLTDQQVQAFTYPTFAEAYIKFELIDAPAQALPEPVAKPKKKRGRPAKKKE